MHKQSSDTSKRQEKFVVHLTRHVNCNLKLEKNKERFSTAQLRCEKEGGTANIMKDNNCMHFREQGWVGLEVH